jgi:predicted dehydrogenase
MERLRFGLLGTGYWALHTQGAALASSPYARLDGVWGRHPDKAHDIAARLGTTAYEDLDELLGRVDAVAISLAPDAQATLAVRAARAGCHLLLDKPLALELGPAQAVVDAVEETGVAALVFFTDRFRPEVERWTEQAAQAGPWHSAHLLKYANIDQPGNPFGASPWRRERGALWDIGPHALAALLPIMGEVTSVAAQRGPAGSDTVHLVLRHAPGPPGSPLPGTPGGTSTASLSLTMPSPAITNRLLLYGENGAWEYRREGAPAVDGERRGDAPLPEARFGSADVMLGAVAELAALVAEGRRAHRCDVRFALEVTRVLAGAEAALGLPAIELAEVGPRP